MKYCLFSIAAFFVIAVSYTQDQPKELSHYVFSDFRPGVVSMKNGKNNIVSINYNALSEEMIFEDQGEKLAIADEQLKDIDTVFVADRKFVVREGRFLEVIKRPGFDLYVDYKCRMKYPGKVNGPGGRTSQTSSSETYLPTDFRRIVYEVVLPNGYTTTPYQYYWLEHNSTLFKFKNFNQLAKVYPTQKKALKAYVKANDLHYDNHEDIIGLIEHLNSL